MPWLLRDGAVLASLEVADDVRTRSRGLMGRETFDGAILLKPAMQVHTIGMRFPIDVAYLDRDLKVVAIVTGMRPRRLGRPRFGARAVVEAEAGAFDRWGLRVGDELEVQ
ncbi:MAG TPA: DUF192 domain-containing protein [Acidimicrobiales bacterium]|nr:DUF192 domain-containing protein [Acidimicrobiales bacterium]